MNALRGCFIAAGLLVLSLRISAQTNGGVSPEPSPKDVVCWMRMQATASQAMRHYMSTGEPLVQEKAADASPRAGVVSTNAPVSTPKPDSSLGLAFPESIVVSASAAQPVTITFSARSGQGLIFWEKSDWIKYKQTLLEEQRQTPASEPVWFPCFALPASNAPEAAAALVHYKFVYDFKVSPAK